MKNYTKNLILVAVILLFSSALSANSLCQNSSCDIDLSFDEGGSITTTGYFTLRFGEGGYFNPGSGGLIVLGASGNLVGTTPQQLQAGGTVNAGVEILVSSDGAINFGTGASLFLGSGGNIDYPAGDNVAIDGASTIDIISTQTEEVVSIQSIDTAGTVNLASNEGTTIYLVDFVTPTGINITSPSGTSTTNVRSWEINSLQISGASSITATGNSNAYILGDSTSTTWSINSPTYPSECTELGSAEGNTVISVANPTNTIGAIDGITCADTTMILQTTGNLTLDDSLDLSDDSNVINYEISVISDPPPQETTDDTASNNGGGGSISLILLALGLAWMARSPRVISHQA